MPFLILLIGAAALLLWRLIQLRGALLRARAGEARFRQLAEHSVDTAWIIDCASAELQYLSPAALEQFGHADAQALAAPLAAGLAERVARFNAGDATARRVRQAGALAHADGRQIPVEVTSTLLADAAGRAQTLVGTIRDLSAAQEQQREQKRFAAMLSHEFRTPLATIDGAVQRLEATGAGADEATRKRYRKIGGAVERLLQLIDDYLTPERMAAVGRQRPADGAAPLALLEAAAAQYDAPAHPVTVRGAALPAYLRCDPDGMRMCLQVLLDNACAYAPAGAGIVLTGRAAPEGGIELCVLDQGPGVAAEELERIFEKAYRGAQAGQSKGSGLGLYMARKVLEVHGGTLTVRNRPEGGAAFRIWLPFPADTGKNLASDDCNSDNSLTQTEAGIHQS
ncbi:PAS domain-containing sensor histidine kinase [Janthinobacterium sp.]|uniref:PAS domain-containing sensor histidine kinase n=1 Tax=Janthinobacterium sp. TaxID=1871054 RepID=UPI00293D2290|nr:PAS domain-containing sensor histidine kinase [Janthinobacterium sp.]